MNKSPYDLVLISTELLHGKWVSEPPRTIATGAAANWTSESDRFLTGTEGYVRYEVQSHELTFHWDVPFAGTNSCEAIVLPEAGSNLASMCHCVAESGDYPVMSFVVDTAPQIRPNFLAIGHSGAPFDRCENTIPGFNVALEQGANALELDLSLTKDGVVVVWHDWDPDSAVALGRQVGGEGYLCRPWVPDTGSGWRRKTTGLTLDELRAHYGYTNVSFAKEQECRVECESDPQCMEKCAPHTDDVIPTLDEFLTRFAEDDRVTLMYFDTKVPSVDDSDPFTSSLYAAVERHPGAASKAVIGSPHYGVHVALRDWLLSAGSDMARSCFFDRQIPPGIVIDPSKYSSVETALAENGTFGAIGRPVLTLEGWEIYRDVMARDCQRRNVDRVLRNGTITFIGWTINKEAEMRTLIGAGVDGMLTDDLPLLLNVITSSYTPSYVQPSSASFGTSWDGGQAPRSHQR